MILKILFRGSDGRNICGDAVANKGIWYQYPRSSAPPQLRLAQGRRKPCRFHLSRPYGAGYWWCAWLAPALQFLSAPRPWLKGGNHPPPLSRICPARTRRALNRAAAAKPMPIRAMNPAMAAARRAVAVLWKPQMLTQAMSRAGGAAGASGLAPRMPTLVISLAVAGAMQVCLTPIPVTHRARAAAAAGRPDQAMPTLAIR